MEQPPSPKIDPVKNHPWMVVAVVGVFNLSVGYFFGHRYRAKAQ